MQTILLEKFLDFRSGAGCNKETKFVTKLTPIIFFYDISQFNWQTFINIFLKFNIRKGCQHIGQHHCQYLGHPLGHLLDQSLGNHFGQYHGQPLFSLFVRILVSILVLFDWLDNNDLISFTAFIFISITHFCVL